MYHSPRFLQHQYLAKFIEHQIPNLQNNITTRILTWTVQIQDISITKRTSHVVLLQPLTLSSYSHPLLTTSNQNSFSISIILSFKECNINRLIQEITFGMGFLWKFIRLMHISIVYSIFVAKWYVMVGMNHILFIHQRMSIWIVSILGSYEQSYCTFVNRFCLNTTSHLYGINVQECNCWVVCLVFYETAKLFCRMDIPFSPIMYQGPSSSAALPPFGVISFMHSDRCVEIPQCSLNGNFHHG